MRKFAVIVMAAGIFGAVPAIASHDMDGAPPKEHVTECVIQADSIQKKIMRIQDEIAKGSTKYSAEELKKLKAKLQDANATLDALSKQ